MKSRTIDIVFAVMSAAFGAFLIFYGFREAGITTDVAHDEEVIDHMMITVPGILLILNGAFYLLRSRFRSGIRFCLANLALFTLVGFIAECFYFQFIYFGLKQPQYKMMISAILIVVAYDILVAVLAALNTCVRKAGK